MTFRPYVSYVGPCVSGPQKGTANLANALLDLYDRSLDFGVFNCRPPSTHSEGRAFDLGFPVVGGKAHAQGYVALANLRANAWDLGITELIWDRKRYTAKHPDGWDYTGPSPHIDHIHMGQTWNAAKTLSLDDAYQLVDMPLTPKEQTALSELVIVRDQLLALGSNLSVLPAAVKLIKALRKVDDVFDTEEF